MLEIKGSYGEGGGQVLRTSLSLACLLGVPFRISNIRASRPKPGLQPQHLTCVVAAQEVTRAEVKGAEINSTSLAFVPTTIASGRFDWDVSRISPSAGSTSLILQTVLPPLVFAPARSTICLKGGTHIPFSPVFEYIQQVFLPSVAALGVRASAEIHSAGYYPIGGGEIRASVEPVGGLRSPGEIARGELQEIRCISLVSRLPLSIADRQMRAMLNCFRRGRPVSRGDILEVPSRGPGTCAFAVARCEGSLAGFSSLGKRGKPAEGVGREAAEGLNTFLASGAALDVHLADQLLLWLCLAKGPFRVEVERVSEHLLTNLWVVQQFLPARVEVIGDLGKTGVVAGEGVGFGR